MHSKILFSGLRAFFALILVGCPLFADSSVNYFSNSTRRAATSVEAGHVVRAGKCTAYFVRNSANKVYVGSARHCFGMSANEWCKTGIFEDGEGNTAACKGVVASDLGRDIVFLEADFKKPPKQTFRLASFEPPAKSRLVMIGYPCDSDRQCALTVTENCWVIQPGVPSPHKMMFDRSALHNCMTWGGNSGGPMVLEGQDAVVGLPFTYLPNDLAQSKHADSSSAAHLAEMADFVRAHRG